MASWDIAVIGGGAAGLSAAATAAVAGLSCIVIDRMGGGGELMNLGALHGVDGAPAGPELAAHLLEAAIVAGAELAIAEVTGLAPHGGGWRLETSDGLHDARAVVLAPGLTPGTLGLPDEAEYEARGLSHCAACDGPLYRGQPVVVAGADRWAVAEARELASIAGAVTLVTQDEAPPPADGFGIVAGMIVGLEGADGLDAVTIRPTDGAAPFRIPTQAVFIQTGRRADTGFAPPDLPRDGEGRLLTDAAGRCGPLPLFAAGDARAGADRTMPAAMADGRRAALAAAAALAELAE